MIQGNVKTPGSKPREKRAPKPRKVVKGRKTPPAGQAKAKTKPKGKRPKKKIISFDLCHFSVKHSISSLSINGVADRSIHSRSVARSAKRVEEDSKCTGNRMSGQKPFFNVQLLKISSK